MKGIPSRNSTIQHDHLLDAVYSGSTVLSTEWRIRLSKKPVGPETAFQTKKSVNPLFTKLKLSNDCITVAPLSYLDENGDEILV